MYTTGMCDAVSENMTCEHITFLCTELMSESLKYKIIHLKITCRILSKKLEPRKENSCLAKMKPRASALITALCFRMFSFSVFSTLLLN